MLALIRRLGTVLLGAALGGGFYLLLIDTTSLPELYVLAGVALGCGVLTWLAHEQGFVEAAIAPWWLGRAWRLVLRVPLDIAIVCTEALAQLVRPRAVRGSFRAVPFAATAQTPLDIGRRATVQALGSVAPNTLVVGVDAERGLLLVHQLRRRGAPDDVDVLRLG